MAGLALPMQLPLGVLGFCLIYLFDLWRGAYNSARVTRSGKLLHVGGEAPYGWRRLNLMLSPSVLLAL